MEPLNLESGLGATAGTEEGDPGCASATATRGHFVRIGVDLGQKLDHTAIVVVEIEPRPPAPGALIRLTQCHYLVRTLRRLELGVSYPAIARRLVDIVAQLRAVGWRPDIWVDATGLGRPVVELFMNAGLYVREVYLNGSDQAVRGPQGELRLGKSLLVSRLQLLLQTERVHLPGTPEAALLADELLNYEIRINDNANAQFGAFKTGAHDDLATALALACWEDYSSARAAILPAIDVIAEAERGWYQ